MRIVPYVYILSSCNYIESEAKRYVSFENTAFWTVDVCIYRNMLEINSARFESGVCVCVCVCVCVYRDGIFS